MVGIVAVAAVDTSASAQKVAMHEAQVVATIVTPISLAKTSDMVFSNTATAAAGKRFGVPAAHTAGVASFIISGQASGAYSIVLPKSISINDGGGRTPTIINLFSSLSVETGGTLDKEGQKTVYVGSTFTFSGVRALYARSTTPFDVIVVYN
jgi:hypothetical protein